MPEFLIVLFHVITIFSAFSTLSLLALLHCYIRQNRFDPPPPPKRNQSSVSVTLSPYQSTDIYHCQKEELESMLLRGSFDQ